MEILLENLPSLSSLKIRALTPRVLYTQYPLNIVAIVSVNKVFLSICNTLNTC